MFVSLAEEFAEHAVAYSLCALEMEPAHDRAIQLAIHYAEQLGGLEDVAPFAAAYVQYNPGGPLVSEARRVAGDIEPRAVMNGDGTGSSHEEGEGAVSNGASRSKGSRSARASGRPAAERDGSSSGVRDGDAADEFGLAAFGSGLDQELDEEEAALAVLSENGSLPPELAIAANVTGPLRELLQAAAHLIQKNRRNEAAQKYKEALAIEPAQPVAIEYLQTFLRRTRRFNELRSLLAAAAGVEGVTYQQRASWLREVASLSESQLSDLEGALAAWRQLAELGASDESASQLRRLLERAGRWHEVAELLRTQADQQSDLEARIALEKDLSRLHQTKLEDPIAAGEAWARIANLTPGDDVAIDTAVKLFESGERHDLAIGVITDNIHSVEDPDGQGGAAHAAGHVAARVRRRIRRGARLRGSRCYQQ